MSYVQVQPGGKSNAKGAKYVNLAWNEWDPKRKRSVQRRFYVGRIAPDGEGVLVNKRFTGGGDVRVPLEDLRARAAERAGFEAWLRTLAGGAAAPEGVARVDIAGDAWLVRHLAEASGLAGTLVQVFGPVEGGALAGLAAHQFATGHALYRAEAWLSQREFPEAWKGPLASESSVHGFVARVGGDVARREEFLEAWVRRHKGSSAVVYDTTSVSSHSPSLELAEWGYNRDDEHLPQVNFSLAATPGGMPLFYRVLPGSIPDVRTVEATLAIARDYGLETLGLSLDRGFFSAANLRGLLELQCPLVIGAPWSVAQARQLFKRHRSKLGSPRHAFLYGGAPLRHVADEWRQDGSVLAAHLFFDPGRHAETAVRFERHILALVEKAGRERFRNWREARDWIAENAGVRAACLRIDAQAGEPRVLPKPNRVAAALAMPLALRRHGARRVHAGPHARPRGGGRDGGGRPARLPGAGHGGEALRRLQDRARAVPPAHGPRRERPGPLPPRLRHARAARRARTAHARRRPAQVHDRRQRPRRAGQGQGARHAQGKPHPAGGLQEAAGAAGLPEGARTGLAIMPRGLGSTHTNHTGFGAKSVA